MVSKEGLLICKRAAVHSLVNLCKICNTKNDKVPRLRKITYILEQLTVKPTHNIFKASLLGGDRSDF
jgi:hypothetical protein